MKIGEQIITSLVDHSPDPVILLRDGVILYHNQQAAQLFGIPEKNSLVANNIFMSVAPGSLSSFQQMLMNLKQDSILDFQEFMFYRHEGICFEAEVKGIPVIFQSEKAVYLLIRDTKERKKTEEFLLHSEKLMAAGQLAAGIAHEIRNPLTAIKGFLQLTEDQHEDTKPYFEIIHAEIDRIELILSELLTLAKPKDMEFKVINNVQDLLHDVTTLIETQAILNNIEIVTNIKLCTPSIQCDENQLKQVFINFLKNSIEAMPDGGQITIDLDVLHDSVQISFRDNGPGIPEHLLNRVEEPFFTTKEKGTGLGLMISKQIIENHNGRFHLFSNAQGTSIIVNLPFTYPSSEAVNI
ncbi:ATP-binding protein [Cytobacillus gottheilii]|uniref:ATP-binding protein n=1 Tax=Cytobacillus gottheilii TaxID=859144 RepID=UPI0009BB7E3F|nr:ATP-binding protein [Cytobacillus gottheilii]